MLAPWLQAFLFLGSAFLFQSTGWPDQFFTCLIFLLDFNQVAELLGNLNILFLVLPVQIHRPNSTASSGFNSTKAISPRGMAGANEGQGPAAALPEHHCHSRGSTKHWWRKRLSASFGCLNFWFLIHLPRALLHCNDYHHMYTKY